MRFSEHELTVALAGAAKTVLAGRDKAVRRGRTDVEDVWQAMSRYERFQLLDAVGDQVLPVLVALPDVEVAFGERATYTDAQVRDTVTAVVGTDTGRLRRAVEVQARVALTQAALAALPPRQDPDTLTIPDSL